MIRPCTKCGAGSDKQHEHAGFGGVSIVLCKVCGAERTEKP